MDERVAVITGGSSGIGASLARELMRGGWTCVLVARGEDRLRTLAAELGAEAEVCDVGDRAAVDALAAVRRDRREVYVPWFYRPGAVLQAIVPSLLARVLARGKYGGPGAA